MSAAVNVERAQLGALGAALGRGAQAIVYDLPGMNLPDVYGPLVYKEYREPYGSPNDLRRTVSDRLTLDPRKRAQLDEISAWPLRVVTDDGEVCGIIMRRVPDSFTDSLALPGTGRTTKTLREVQNLFISPELAQRIGRPVPDNNQRKRICRDFAAALTFFHQELAVAFGDINAKNELYRLGGAASVLFIDCDGVRRTGQISSTDQLNTPDWVPPNREPLSQATDLYKLGLFILRCLCPGPNASTRLDPAPARELLDDTGYKMLEDALRDDPRGRPSAREWQTYLSRLIGDPIEPPVLLSARIDEQWVPAGQPVAVHWQATDAITVDVRGATFADRVDGSAGEGTVWVPLETNYVWVIARNRVGEDVRRIGPIALVSRPPEVPLPVPMPQLRWPPAAALVSPYLPALPVFPHVDVPTPMVAPTELLGTNGPDAGRILPPLSSIAPPFDVTSLILGCPRITATLEEIQP
ncbi:MAG TPA: hypothetical protein VJ914_05055 [Pseudonocardiaceae bacterium]|nr:hypothetical protein [Pseudonocardiaceae bacterium]